MRIGFMSSSAAESWRRAATASLWNRRGCTTPCGGSRLASGANSKPRPTSPPGPPAWRPSDTSYDPLGRVLLEPGDRHRPRLLCRFHVGAVDATANTLPPDDTYSRTVVPDEDCTSWTV